ncbi:right-handed parallel beta-helix repeat-containing protein [Gaetbulibacter aestuarii]|uniref:Right-handed parallel beta-helix repeat-containing protein n=1 Tax=Gaetbulibacter aestuarii TaxID=1502358 RepID=A0ABW7N056_9FLAO
MLKNTNRFFWRSFGIIGIVIGLLWSCETSNNSSKSYYFNPVSGNDTNSGDSENSAFKSLRKISALKLEAGDHIYLAAGETFLEPLELREVKGSETEPVLISTYGKSKDTLAHIKVEGALNGVLIKNCQNLSLQNLNISAKAKEDQNKTEERTMRCGILVQITKNDVYQNISLKNIKIKDVFYEKEGFTRPKNEVKSANGTQNYGWGIRIINQTQTGFIKNIRIQNAVVDNVSHTGIKLTSRDHTDTYGIDTFEISNSQVTNTGGPGIQMSGVKNGHIFNNSVDHSGSANDSRKWGRGSGLWTWGSRDILIEKNRFTNANGPGDSAGAHIDFNCNNVILQYNFSAHNAGGFCEILGNNYNCAYRYNISVNDGYRIKGENGAFQEGKVFWLSGYSGKKRRGPFNSYFYNNTIYVKDSLTAKIAIDRLAKGILIANNIFQIEGSSKLVKGDQYNPETEGAWLAEDVIFKNNLFFTDKSWPKNLKLQDTHPYYGNAQFSKPGGLLPEYYIPNNIDLIQNKGIQIEKLPQDSIGIIYGLQVKNDILGRPIKNLPDLGAIELNQN